MLKSEAIERVRDHMQVHKITPGSRHAGLCEALNLLIGAAEDSPLIKADTVEVIPLSVSVSAAAGAALISMRKPMGMLSLRRRETPRYARAAAQVSSFL